MSFPDNLDIGGPLRCQEHLGVLFKETTPGIMWDQYGMVGNLFVHISRCPFANFPAAIHISLSMSGHI